MKIIALAFLSCSSLLFAQAAPQAAKNEFQIVIEGVNCVVKTYKPIEPIIFEPLVNKDTLPKSQLITSIMLTSSDITSYLSDEDFSKYIKSVLVNEEEKQAEREKFRAGMKKMNAMTAADAEENPWKGMKYAIDQVFIVKADAAKFLVYQISAREAKEVGGQRYGTRKFVDGLWIMGGDKDEKLQKFKLSMMELVPKEFEKLEKEAGVVTLPLEDLLL